MNFINPLFFLGALAAAVPILLHLVRRERAQKIEFPTLMFLRRISKKTIRYQKLRHLILLLLRVLTLLLLALAFTRPFRDIPQAAAAGGRVSVAHIILLDNSMSMGYGDRWSRARSAATDIVGRAAPGDEVALLEFSDRALVRTSLTADYSEALFAIEKEAELSDRSTQYSQALRTAEKIALDSRTGRRVIYLISDFQKSGWAAAEEQFRLGSGVELKHVDVGSGDFSNLVFGDVNVLEEDEGGGSQHLKASVINYGTEDRQSVRLMLHIGGRTVADKRIDIEKGGVQGVEFMLPGLSSGTHLVVLQVEDTRLERDNRFSMTVEARGKTPVLCVQGAADVRGQRSPSYFLASALNLPGLSPYSLNPIQPQGLEAAAGISGKLLIWNNTSGGSAALQRKVQNFVRGGGGLVVILADSSLAEDFNRSFGSWLPLRIEKAGSRSVDIRPSESYALLTDFRVDHPIFRLFGVPHSGSFYSARFFKHARLTVHSGAEVLARFDNGDPALALAAVDKGRVLVFTSSADDATNDLPLKAVYAPFWQQMLRFLENFREGRSWVAVGEMIAPRELFAEAALRQAKGNIDTNQSIAVLDPLKQRVPMAQGVDTITVDKVGFYEIRSSDLNTTVAVNSASRESDLSHGNAEEMISGWMSAEPDAAPAIAEDELLSPEEQDKRQNLWRYLLLAALVFFISEGLLANQAISKREERPGTGSTGIEQVP